MSQTSWKPAGTVINDCYDPSSLGSGTAWTSPASAQGASDSRNANTLTWTNSVPISSPCGLRCHNFGFTTSDIPTGAIINGISFQITRYSTDTGGVGNLKDLYVYAIPASGTGPLGIGTNASGMAPWLVSVGTYETPVYGGSGNLWGQTWGASSMVASTFGIFFAPTASTINKNMAVVGEVDSVYCQITFSLPVTLAPASSALAQTFSPSKRIQKVLSTYASALAQTFSPSFSRNIHVTALCSSALAQTFSPTLRDHKVVSTYASALVQTFSPVVSRGNLIVPITCSVTGKTFNPTARETTIVRVNLLGQINATVLAGTISTTNYYIISGGISHVNVQTFSPIFRNNSNIHVTAKSSSALAQTFDPVVKIQDLILHTSDITVSTFQPTVRTETTSPKGLRLFDGYPVLSAQPVKGNSKIALINGKLSYRLTKDYWTTKL